MARILVTGSADGLGALAARELLSQGHQVILHARNHARGQAALAAVPGADTVLIADLSKTDEVLSLAQQANALGPYDAVIHNAGVYNVSHEEIFAVNSLAPYLLTCLIGSESARPRRLIYLGSGDHRGGRALLNNLEQGTSYADSKFQILLLTKAVARAWPTVYANALDPGWVPTKMGGESAPDDLEEGYATQVWLATSEDKAAKVSGKYFFHRKPARCASGVEDTFLQDAYVSACARITGIKLR
jgi:NAD(P)-dependent dehydrogenase (short-subunit alcohol dehydrogenase family)